MRTTLTLDVDVLMAVRDLAMRQNTTIGNVVSALVRQALTEPQAEPASPPTTFYGFDPLPVRDGPIVTDELVSAIREEEGI